MVQVIRPRQVAGVRNEDSVDTAPHAFSFRLPLKHISHWRLTVPLYLYYKSITRQSTTP